MILTSGRKKTPVAKIEAIEPVKRQRLGLFFQSQFLTDRSFFLSPFKMMNCASETGKASSDSARHANLALGFTLEDA